MTDPRRAIPAIDRLLASDVFAPVLARAPRPLVRDALQAVQDELRERIAADPGVRPYADPGWYAERVHARLSALERSSLRRVINATGVVLHTNLGRAPLAPAARDAMLRAASGYCNLEYDVETGERGSRYDHCTALLTELTGAEAALVVNNNAAALVLALNTLAEGRDAVVSRGELVEIGGSFRVPEIMARSGARMREVGATNRTHLADYEAVAGAKTGVLLKVHRSNFLMRGFTAEVALADLAEVGRVRGVPVVEDLGSGLLLDLSPFGLPREPTARDELGAGADVVTMSGDKLLGGPQAGILLGRADLIGQMRQNPLCRAFRVDKLTLAALEATLAMYRDPDTALREIPVLRMLTLRADALEARARGWMARLAEAGVAARIVADASAVGGGAYPAVELPTTLVAVAVPGRPAREVAARLRLGDPAVAARIADDCVVLDPRTVAEEEEEELIRSVCNAAG